MAIQTFNSIDGFSVGNPQTTVINGAANVSANSLSVSANANITGNITGGNISTTGNITATGNISADYFIGNGSQLTGLPAGYSNGDVANYLSSGTVTSNIITTGNISADYFIGNGSQLTDLPSGGIEYVYKTSAYTVTSNQGVLADTTGGVFTVTLPATPATGDQCVVADAGGVFGANNCTVGRNGSTIVGIAQDLALDIDGVSVQFIYDGSTWEVYSQVGGAGGAASAYGNTQVSAYLASGTDTAGFTTTGNISGANLTATGSISNSRIVTRVASTTSGSSLTPNGDTTDQYEVTALAVGATINAPSGTPNDGQRLIIRIDDDGSAQSLSWDAIYRVVGTTLPTTTVAGKTLYVGCVYNTNKTKWDVIALSQEA